jgi:alginate O-acetyltransferase complex protein AlgI
VLRDYLYCPLGGNRRGEVRTYVNLGVVMLLGGLWHGAKWNFLVWGAFHGGWLAWERWRGKRSLYAHWPRPLRVGLTFLLMLLSWVLFRAEDLGAAGRYFGALVGWTPAGGAAVLVGAEIYRALPVAAMAAGAVVLGLAPQAHDWSRGRQSWGRVGVLVPLFVVSVVVLFSQAFNPFLYFQF